MTLESSERQNMQPIPPGRRWLLLAVSLSLLLLRPAHGAGSKAAARTGNDSFDAALFDAIRNGDNKSVRHMLHERTAVDTQDESGATLLMCAALYADADVVRWLLDRGADPNLTNQAGATALMYGTRDPRKVKLLLAHGADPNAASKAGNTALIIAAGGAGTAGSLEALLAKGVEVNAHNEEGVTPLIRAASVGNARNVKLLLDHGARVNARARTFHLPGEPPEEGFSGVNAVMQASYFGHTECVNVLLAAGADLNAKDTLGDSLLRAASRDERAAAKMLLDHGAKANVVADGGYTPLMWAAYSEAGDPGIVEMLLAKGANVNAEATDGDTALAWARKRGNTAVIAALLRAGAKESGIGGKSAKPDTADDATTATASERSGVKSRVEKTLGLLLASGRTFSEKKKATCVSCHHQSLPAMAVSVARERGYQVDETIAADQLGSVLRAWTPHTQRLLECMDALPDMPVTGSYTLVGLAAMKHAPDKLIDAMVHQIASAQTKEGRWLADGPRPPLEYSDFTATAMSLRAIQLYAPEGRRSELGKQIERARDWLLKAKPRFNEELTFKLLGLAWSGASRNEIQKAARALLAEQRPDGGWAQLAHLESDAYATGQALYALHQAAGLPASDPAYQRGINFLLRTQYEDGSWLVRTRTFPFQPFFPSGFPHGKNQWISAAGTSWAAMALMLGSESAKVSSAGHESSRASREP